MISKTAVGFAAVLLVAGTGVDYHLQSMKQDVALGQLSASGYYETIQARIDGFKAGRAEERALAKLKKRQKAGARMYLPEAPEGWQRRTLAEGDNSAIFNAPREISQAEQDMLDSSQVLKAMTSASAGAKDQRLNAETWVYERGDDIVSVRARFSPKIKGNSMTANAMKMIAGNMSGLSNTEGWGVIQGVAYGQPGSFDASDVSKFTRLTATMGFGSEVKLEVRSTASEAVIREILDVVDYDGLNALLPRPLPYVGKDAPVVAMAEQKEMAGKMIDIRTELIQRRGQQAEQAMIGAGSSNEAAMAMALNEIGFGDSSAADAADAKAEQDLQNLEQSALSQSETDSAGGGVWGMMTGMFGGGDEEEAATEPTEVRRLQTGGGNSISTCSSSGKGKRCVVEGN